jgi:hypothetical protein
MWWRGVPRAADCKTWSSRSGSVLGRRSAQQSRSIREDGVQVQRDLTIALYEYRTIMEVDTFRSTASWARYKSRLCCGRIVTASTRAVGNGQQASCSRGPGAVHHSLAVAFKLSSHSRLWQSTADLQKAPGPGEPNCLPSEQFCQATSTEHTEPCKKHVPFLACMATGIRGCLHSILPLWLGWMPQS